MYPLDQKATLQRITGRNINGEATIADPINIHISVVRLNQEIEKTSVRTDSSASRGSSKEKLLSATILTNTDVKPEPGDKINFIGREYEVASLEERFDLFGHLDHYQLSLVRWGS